MLSPVHQLLTDNMAVVFMLPMLLAAGYFYWMYAHSPWVKLAAKYPAGHLPDVPGKPDCNVAAININRVQYTARRAAGYGGVQNYVVPHADGLYLTTKAVVFDKRPICMPWHTVRKVSPAPDADGLAAMLVFHEIELEVQGQRYLLRLQNFGTDRALINRIAAMAR